MMKLKIFIILILLFIPFHCFGLDRCIEFKNDVRIQHTKYFGLNFPWQYGIAQLKQESGCRADVTAFDAGMGVAQFMPATSKYIQSLMGEALDPYQPEQAIKMQAFYMYRIQTKENFSKEKKLFITYQIYNGGAGNLKKEYIRANNKADWELMKNQCKRSKVLLKNGTYLYFCEVNYDYSQRIFKYGNSYYPLKSTHIFW